MAPQDLYRIRDFVPDFDAIAAEFVGRSRELSARSELRADIRYGPRRREVLDVILPERPGANAPMHVFVHGGYWRSGEKENYRFVAAPILAAGGVAAFVEYDLMPGSRLDVLVDQVRRGVSWLQQHASDFGADPLRFTVSGHSAGAHLASFLAARGPRELEVEAAPLPALRGLLLLSGIYDLSDIPDSFLRDEAKMTATEAEAWSPLTAIPAACPMRLIAFGADETSPFHDQATSLHAMLHSQSQTSRIMNVPHRNHMSIVLELGDPASALGKCLVDMVSAA